MRRLLLKDFLRDFKVAMEHHYWNNIRGGANNQNTYNNFHAYVGQGMKG
jgi:hypothetical protein